MRNEWQRSEKEMSAMRIMVACVSLKMLSTMATCTGALSPRAVCFDSLNTFIAISSKAFWHENSLARFLIAAAALMCSKVHPLCAGVCMCV
jgi:hypothetical protein